MTKWKVHEKRQGQAGLYRQFDDELIIMTNSTGELKLSKKSLEALNSPDYVLCMSNENLIGLAPCRKTDENSYAVNKSDYIVAAKTFTKKLKLKPYRILKARIEDGRLVADVTQPFISVQDGIK